MPYKDPAKKLQWHLNWKRTHGRATIRRWELEDFKRKRKRAEDRLGGVCERCSITVELEFHHVDPSKKEADVNKIWRLSWTRIWKEVSKCVLLCKPCHMIVDGRIDASEYADYCSVPGYVPVISEKYQETLPDWVTEEF